jgi:hypothetical protein
MKTYSKIEKVRAIGSLLKLGKGIKEAVHESNKYFSIQPKGIFVDKRKYEDIMKKYDSITDFVIECINEKIPNFAFKSITNKGN